jgi:hypothetical protein
MRKQQEGIGSVDNLKLTVSGELEYIALEV